MSNCLGGKQRMIRGLSTKMWTTLLSRSWDARSIEDMRKKHNERKKSTSYMIYNNKENNETKLGQGKSRFLKDKHEVQRNWNVVKAAQILLFNLKKDK